MSLQTRITALAQAIGADVKALLAGLAGKAPAVHTHSATSITNAPAGNIAATNVQAAINELDAEKLPKSGGAMTGAITFAGTQTWPTFNQSTTGNAATATKLATARTINGVSFDGTANITVADSTKLPLAGGTMTGSLTFTGTSRRIRIPFIGIPVASRTLFQSADANTATYIGVIPNGTSRSSGITFSNSSDPDNGGYGYISMSDVDMTITSGVALGTGGTGGAPGAVPLVLAGRGGAKITIGDDAVAVTGGVLGYGSGSGGAANQPTSKTAPVTLNKPGGMITTHAASLAAGAAQGFTLNNSVIANTDVVVATISYHGGAGLNYRVAAHTGLTGQCVLTLQNISGAARAEAIEIHFVVLKKVNG